MIKVKPHQLVNWVNGIQFLQLFISLRLFQNKFWKCSMFPIMCKIKVSIPKLKVPWSGSCPYLPFSFTKSQQMSYLPYTVITNFWDTQLLYSMSNISSLLAEPYLSGKHIIFLCWCSSLTSFNYTLFYFHLPDRNNHSLLCEPIVPCTDFSQSTYKTALQLCGS